MTLTVVLVIGLTGVAAQRVRLRVAQNGLDAVEARMNAESGLDVAMQRIADSATWRLVVPPSGDWITNQRVGRGAFSINLTDPSDGVVLGLADDPIVIRSTGSAGSARQILSVRMDSRSDPLSCLGAALCAGGDIVFGAITAAADQPISTNSTMTASGSTVNATVESAGAISGSSYTGTKKQNNGTREMPANDALDSYIARATPISILLIPSRRIEKTVLGPGVNPYGLANAEGIYSINCLGQDLELRDCRIYGTLIITNAAGGVRIRDSVNMETPNLANPAVAVVGPLLLELAPTSLQESSVGANLNPAGVPYSGVTDSDTSDSYPSSITGLVYVTGNLQLTPSGGNSTGNVIKGTLVVGGKVSADGPLAITYQASLYASPPKGFRGNYRMAITPGSWTQVVE